MVATVGDFSLIDVWGDSFCQYGDGLDVPYFFSLAHLADGVF